MINYLWRFKFCTKITELSMSFSIVLKECILILCIFLSIDLQTTELLVVNKGRILLSSSD